MQNLKYLKEDYLYFDKYGKQRRIEFAVFLRRKKIAVIFEGQDTPVFEEYRTGDRKIVETSLVSQGWEIYFWSASGNPDGRRKKTGIELRNLLGRKPEFLDHMDTCREGTGSNKFVTPVLILVAFAGAAVLFPKISDKLFSYTGLSKDRKEIVRSRTNNPTVSERKFKRTLKKEKSQVVDSTPGKEKVETVEINSEDF